MYVIDSRPKIYQLYVFNIRVGWPIVKQMYENKYMS